MCAICTKSQVAGDGARTAGVRWSGLSEGLRRMFSVAGSTVTLGSVPRILENPDHEPHECCGHQTAPRCHRNGPSPPVPHGLNQAIGQYRNDAQKPEYGHRCSPLSLANLSKTSSCSKADALNGSHRSRAVIGLHPRARAAISPWIFSGSSILRMREGHLPRSRAPQNAPSVGFAATSPARGGGSGLKMLHRETGELSRSD